MEFGSKKLGFGMMRLPMIEENGQKWVDEPQTCKMVDRFLEEGFCYFDTAHGYLEEKSEIAVRECLAKRHPRESYILTNKLSTWFFEKEEEIDLRALLDDMKDTDKQIAEVQNEFVSMLRELTSEDENIMSSLNSFIGMIEG